MALTTPIASLMQNRITLPGANEANRVQIANNTIGQSDSRNTVDFTKVFQGALEQVSSQQETANQMQENIEMGLSTNLVGTMIASEKASLSFQAVVQVRNRVVSAYETVFNMPV